MTKIYLILFSILFASYSAKEVAAQEIHSKFPCNSSQTYDILMDGARYSGESFILESEIQLLILDLTNFKDISGQYSICFVVQCNGTTTKIDTNFRVNTLDNESIKDYLLGIVEGGNWMPAVHRGERVPHKRCITVKIKKGKIKSFSI